MAFPDDHGVARTQPKAPQKHPEDAAPIVGERVALPSGEKVRVTAAGDPARPWQAIELGLTWQVIRLNYDLVVAHATHSFGGSKHPRQFDKADAEALAKLLNRARP